MHAMMAKNEPLRSTRLRRGLALLGCVAVCLMAAGAGGAITSTSMGSWYQKLAKPIGTPPDWVFGPVWTALYLMMGVSAWLVWDRAGCTAARRPLAWFAAQLALNVGWSAVFFGLRSPGWAFAEIAVLWLSILTTIVAFWSCSRAAALLLAPYLAWTCFAAWLNFAIWRMNS